jgi:hypothetical protein
VYGRPGVRRKIFMEIKEMRAECVRHYVERRNTPDHADLIVPKDEDEICRIYGCIQEEQKKANRFKKVPRPLEGLNTVEIVEVEPDEETAAE